MTASIEALERCVKALRTLEDGIGDQDKLDLIADAVAEAEEIVIPYRGHYGKLYRWVSADERLPQHPLNGIMKPIEVIFRLREVCSGDYGDKEFITVEVHNIGGRSRMGWLYEDHFFVRDRRIGDCSEWLEELPPSFIKANYGGGAYQDCLNERT